MNAILETSSPTKPHHILAHPGRFRSALITGVYVGALLIVVMCAALIAANRFPSLEPYALERNAASYGTFVLVMLIPILRFLTRPLQTFLSGIVAWTLFIGAYNIAGFYFRNLFDMRTPFEALIEGGLFYGVVAAGTWVLRMGLHARRHSIAPRRRRVHDVVRSR